MGDKTRIEWTDATWNPVTGCTKVSAGCDHCYAETLAERFRGTPGHYYENGFDVQLRPAKLDQPLRWRNPRRVFVNSMSDLFHKDIGDAYIARVFAVMALAPSHTFQVLTKRHGRMRSLLSRPDFQGMVNDAAWLMRTGEDPDVSVKVPGAVPIPQRLQPVVWPLPNVWVGVSVEDQAAAELRVPALLDTPAAVRFLSCEPLLGPVDLCLCLRPGRPFLHSSDCAVVNDDCWLHDEWADSPYAAVDWVIVGGESGRGARPMHPDWARSLRDQCVAHRVPFHFKQWGEHDPSGVRVGKGTAGRVLDGRTWDEAPPL